MRGWSRIVTPLCILVAALGPVPAGALARSFSTVVIDAGHGGYDRGGIPGQQVAESVVALDVARRLSAYLQRAGLRTVMTRNSDVFGPLGTRTATANRYSRSIFVSVHFNSSRNRDADGIETYYYSSRSASLAANIHKSVVTCTRGDNRGIKRRGFYVIRKTRSPSVLVECGFLTNAAEAARIQSASYRQQLAERIGRGILNTK